jgi:glycosyltransferase involved in cell wall biosynthesis
MSEPSSARDDRGDWIVIPAYQPEPVLARIVDDLIAVGLPAYRLVVVDDGSTGAAARVVDGLRGRGPVVVRHADNRGKGAALKAGIRAVRARDPDPLGVVTADADGQHAVGDILRVRDALLAAPDRLVLGSRAFDAATPRRSRFGNAATRQAFRLATGRRLADTQTGLRGLPAALLDHALGLPGTRYDFELELLLAAVDAGVPVAEVGIRTIYGPGNATSHFRVVSDSWRIYRVFLRRALGARGTSAVQLDVGGVGPTSSPSAAADDRARPARR